MTGVLVAAGGAPWASLCVAAVRDATGMTLARDCADVTELLAGAVAGLGELAVVNGLLPGLDADAVATLGRAGVTVVAIAASPDAQDWLLRLGVAQAVAPAADVGSWQDLLSGAAPGVAVRAESASGDVLVVCGPHGGPGRTTVAVALAHAAAAAGTSTLLLDLDPDGGSVAQHLGLTDDQSALTTAVRAAQEGTLGTERLMDLAEDVRPRLHVLGGLPRPDRWTELRRGPLDLLLETSREAVHLVVVDAGSDIDRSAEQWGGAGPARNTATLTALDAADRLVVVGSADAVGVARLLRHLMTLSEGPVGSTVDVVVNRFRASLGWSSDEVADLVLRVVPGAGVHVLADDSVAADRAMRAAHSPWLDDDSDLGRGLRDACVAILGTSSAPPTMRSRRRLRR